MNNWLTTGACVMFLIFLVILAFTTASDWLGMVIQQVRFGRSMYGEFKTDKQEWEKKKASQETTTREAAGTDGSSAGGSDQTASGGRS